MAHWALWVSLKSRFNPDLWQVLPCNLRWTSTRNPSIWRLQPWFPANVPSHMPSRWLDCFRNSKTIKHMNAYHTIVTSWEFQRQPTHVTPSDTPKSLPDQGAMSSMTYGKINSGRLAPKPSTTSESNLRLTDPLIIEKIQCIYNIYI